jgi:hypothetical protein
MILENLEVTHVLRASKYAPGPRARDRLSMRPGDLLIHRVVEDETGKDSVAAARAESKKAMSRPTCSARRRFTPSHSWLHGQVAR